MADILNEMLGKFMALSQEEKEISSAQDAAFKEYNDYCASSDQDLERKTGEIHEKMKKLDYLIEYAREHAQPDGLEPAPEPFETSAGQLESIRQTIKLDSHNDPNAETLYTKVTGQQMFYEKKIEDTKHLIESSKVQAKRQYDSEIASLNERKEQHDGHVLAYIRSNDFKEYLKLLTFDKSAFNSPGTVELPSKDFISIGQRRVKLSVPMEAEMELSDISNGEYNSAARTIGAPYQLSTKSGGVMILDYDERNRTYLLGGIQRLLLNLIKYVGDDITDMIFCEPTTFTADGLGHISALGKGANPFITVPVSISDAEQKLSEFAAAAEASPTPDKVSRVLVLDGFPENYMDDVLEKAVAVCRSAKKNGVLVLLTHDAAVDETPAEKEVRTLATSIRSRNGGFWIESARESLFWYSAPSDIPDEIRRKYIEQRRPQTAAQSEPAQAVQPETVKTEQPVQSVQPVQPRPVAQPGYETRPEDEIPETVRRTEDGQPVPAHILFNLPRPTPEEKEVSLTGVSQLSGSLEPEPVKPAPEPVRPAPEPVRPAPEPVRPAPEPVRPAPEPVRPAPEPVRPAPEPVRPAPEPVRPAPEPVRPAPEPVRSAPEPVRSAPEPVRSASEPLRSAPATAPAVKPASNARRKGERRHPEVKIGMSVDGNAVNMDISGGITFICGSKGGDRQQLTDRIITQIMECSHPDDAELWLYDCGDGELMKYAQKPEAHIRYVVSDNDGETAFDFIDVISSELEQRIVAANKNGWDNHSAVPATEYMPRIFIVVNEFARLLENVAGAPRYFGRSLTNKLAAIFGKCADHGIHFVLTSQTFLINGKRPECLEHVSVHCAAAVGGCDSGAKEMFGHIKLYENEIESLKKVPEGCAFVAAESSTDGLVMVRMLTAQMPLNNRFVAVSEYRTGYDEYVDKHPLQANRRLRTAHADHSAIRAEMIAAKGKEETLLFLGEPCRFRSVYPIRMYEEFGENLLAIAPERERTGAALMVISAIRSLNEQGKTAEVLAWKSNPVYGQLREKDALKGITVLEGDKAEARVKEIAADIAAGKHTDAFEIVLGGDLLLAAMHADDCLADLKCALVKGSRLGAHFMFVSGSVAQLAAGFISLFRHRLVFSCPQSDAEKILRDTGCDLPENAFRLSNDYDELTMLPYSM